MRLALAVLAMSAAPALAQQMPCGRTAEIEAFIKGEGETPVGAGITSSGFALMVFANPETSAFTITLRRPDGITCLMVGGEGFTMLPPLAPVAPGKEL